MDTLTVETIRENKAALAPKIQKALPKLAFLQEHEIWEALNYIVDEKLILDYSKKLSTKPFKKLHLSQFRSICYKLSCQPSKMIQLELAHEQWLGCKELPPFDFKKEYEESFEYLGKLLILQKQAVATNNETEIIKACKLFFDLRRSQISELSQKKERLKKEEESEEKIREIESCIQELTDISTRKSNHPFVITERFLIYCWIKSISLSKTKLIRLEKTLRCKEAVRDENGTFLFYGGDFAFSQSERYFCYQTLMSLYHKCELIKKIDSTDYYWQKAILIYVYLQKCS